MIKDAVGTHDQAPAELRRRLHNVMVAGLFALRERWRGERPKDGREMPGFLGLPNVVAAVRFTPGPEEVCESPKPYTAISSR